MENAAPSLLIFFLLLLLYYSLVLCVRIFNISFYQKENMVFHNISPNVCYAETLNSLNPNVTLALCHTIMFRNV